ncbi:MULTISPECIES: polysaccharide deacetylase family protein [unclassified Sphingomonas]|uniref:polysaccharide deacetylase family protein n=1 Tax=unclassified Sphingomonas TaxID=196159 RepID=UPI0006FB9EBD|nr:MULTISPECIES: polysaccharide deacetylase family protein [unclassified Sphingomonas]KQX18053.1 polysaccharide deacetylase [Sphingomonas sp. Root1294]KQY72608.1 polysaccharide deacetylase [Sphingomonas sp. Root50]KRB87768.1 polysaccharide deacetylase [Sphingomonas sp. Root720]
MDAGRLSPAPAEMAAETRVLLTIDTALYGPRVADGAQWQAAYDRSYQAAGVGVGYQLRILAQYALKACFFVDPMPACAYGIEPIRHMVDPILEAGQEVQLHLYPFRADPGGDHGRDEGGLAHYDAQAQRDLIDRARDLLMEAGAPDPVAFRAGDYSANDDTLRALADLGLRFDSSHNGHRHPRPSAIGLPREQIAPVLHQGVTEVPVTLIAEGRGARALQIRAVSLGEIKAAILHAADHGLPIVTIAAHSFDLANRAGTAPNRILVKRFEDLCAFLSMERRRFPTAFFTELDDLPLDRPSVLLPSAGLRRMGRAIEQIWSDRIEERAP